MHNPSAILKPVHNAPLGVGVIVQKETCIIPLLTTEEKTTLDSLAKIFVTNLLKQTYDESKR
jgi:hypothetical protein